jgi:hypothetical protein
MERRAGEGKRWVYQRSIGFCRGWTSRLFFCLPGGMKLFIQTEQLTAHFNCKRKMTRIVSGKAMGTGKMHHNMVRSAALLQAKSPYVSQVLQGFLMSCPLPRTAVVIKCRISCQNKSGTIPSSSSSRSSSESAIPLLSSSRNRAAAIEASTMKEGTICAPHHAIAEFLPRSRGPWVFAMRGWRQLPRARFFWPRFRSTAPQFHFPAK